VEQRWLASRICSISTRRQWGINEDVTDRNELSHVRLAEAGCSPHEIAAITGHASLEEIVRYTTTVDRKRLACAAMEKVKTGTFSVKPDERFDKKREKS
jgi:hypothetical protein